MRNDEKVMGYFGGVGRVLEMEGKGTRSRDPYTYMYWYSSRNSYTVEHINDERNHYPRYPHILKMVPSKTLGSTSAKKDKESVFLVDLAMTLRSATKRRLTIIRQNRVFSWLI